MECVGLHGLFKDIELEATGQDKNYQTLIITPSVVPPPLPEQLGLLLPAPTRKGMWPTPYPAP